MPIINAINNKAATTPTTTGTIGNSAAAPAAVVGSAALEVDISDGDSVVDMASSDVVMAELIVDDNEPELDGGADDDEVSVDLSTIAVKRIATNNNRTTESVRRKRAVAELHRAAALAQAH